jgi:N-acyl-L-homoserine lactone synthetase
LGNADAFAANALCRIAPLTFGVARTWADLQSVYRLRYEVVIHQGWGRIENFPDGLERDAFDEQAIHVVGWDCGKLIGTTRLVAPAPGLRLPTEAAFDLDIASRGPVIDMGRTCREPGRTDIGHRIFWGLLSQAWLELRARGFTEICGIFSPAVKRLYQRMGFRVELLGPPRPYWGEDRHPVLVRPAETIETLRLASV